MCLRLAPRARRPPLLEAPHVLRISGLRMPEDTSVPRSCLRAAPQPPPGAPCHPDRGTRSPYRGCTLPGASAGRKGSSEGVFCSFSESLTLFEDEALRTCRKALSRGDTAQRLAVGSLRSAGPGGAAPGRAHLAALGGAHGSPPPRPLQSPPHSLGRDLRAPGVRVNSRRSGRPPRLWGNHFFPVTQFLHTPCQVFSEASADRRCPGRGQGQSIPQDLRVRGT